MRQRADLLAHVQNTNSQYNLDEIGKRIAYKRHRAGVAERFADTQVQKSVAVDFALIEYLNTALNDLELTITRLAKEHDPQGFYLLRSVPGIGKILALVILYETHDIRRFPSVQNFTSYSRLVKCAKESAGKHYGYSGQKNGNAFLKWAFGALSTRQSSRAKNSLIAWRANTARAKLSPSSHTASAALSITCYAREKPSTANASSEPLNAMAGAESSKA